MVLARKEILTTMALSLLAAGERTDSRRPGQPGYQLEALRLWLLQGRAGKSQLLMTASHDVETFLSRLLMRTLCFASTGDSIR